jgi:hypothetical protein
MHPGFAALDGNPYTLRAALDREEPCDWDDVMSVAVWSGSLDCVNVLYDKGYEQHRSRRPSIHPAVFAVQYLQLKILRFVVDRSGPPRAEELHCANAVEGGVEMLQYVRELGCVFDERTTEAAATWADLEALQYLHVNGAPWNSCTLAAAVEVDSLPCLEYAHTHGCPHDDVKHWVFLSVRPCSLPVLRYVCEHLNPAFAAQVLYWTSNVLSCQVTILRRVSEPLDEGLDWPLVLYLGRKLGADLPEALAEAKATRTERAAALAGIFLKAGKQLRAEETRLLHREAAGGEENSIITKADAEWMALWDAMARVPKELQERIAVEAELIML